MDNESTKLLSTKVIALTIAIIFTVASVPSATSLATAAAGLKVTTEIHADQEELR